MWDTKKYTDNKNGTFNVTLINPDDYKEYEVVVKVDHFKHTIDCDWCQKIINRFSKVDADKIPYMINADSRDDAFATAICYLEKKECICQDEDGNWFKCRKG